MIVKIRPGGRSFKALAAYLMHDTEKARTSGRVAWTHTVNLAFDHPDSAVNEMLWTYRAAEQLKRQAGLRAGGRPLKYSVKHYSLSWHPSEAPTKEQMIKSAESFLKRMGASEHQAILWAHNDKPHPHLHIMLGVTHPETGRALDTGFEWRTAQNWALEYERDTGMIFCLQRLLPENEREPSPTRETWQKLKEAERAHDKAEIDRLVKAPDYFERGDRVHAEQKEWEALKVHQRQEREAFFVGGKQAYREVRNQIFREVRTEFRERWRKYYAAQRAKDNPKRLAAMKTDILRRQNTELGARRDQACADLRKQRDTEYRHILDGQKEQRAELAARQEQGLRSPQLLDLLHGIERGEDKSGSRAEAGDGAPVGVQKGFRRAADETCKPDKEGERAEREHKVFAASSHERHRVRDPANAIGDLGLSAISGTRDHRRTAF